MKSADKTKKADCDTPSSPVQRDFHMRIDQEGRWYHEGDLIKRIELVKLFARVLSVDEAGQHWLRTPVEFGQIEVEDAPFIAVEVNVEKDTRSNSEIFVFRTNLDENVVCGPENPLRVQFDPSTEEPRPYILVRNGLEARLTRSVYYELVEMAIEQETEGQKVLGICKDIIILSRKVASLDVCSTLGYIAKIHNWCCPLIDDSKDFIIKDGRHSVVEKTLFKKSLNAFVPNDCSLSTNQHLWLITGPNMAGKSTFLRQNAHIIILAQIGSYVPAKEAKIGVANKLFSRIGASDNISKGQSTFMVEMLETSNIIKNADDRSFIILDEIGRGTSTFDGLAIAWAIIERVLRNNKSRTLFATHYHELTEIEKNNSKVKNVSCEIKEWNDEIIYSYKVIAGKSKGSLGIKVAELAGFPNDVIREANALLGKLQKKGVNKNDIVLKEEDFQTERILKVKDEIDKIDLDTITPLEALNILHKLKSNN